jgi:CheY-like chemotaxis protein
MPTALIVEDEPEANRLLSLLVQLRGYRTESAYTGEEALEKLGARTPDVVFLDLMLPDVNGFDVCRTIKARRATNLIPVVMVTARLADENRTQSYRVGANDFIPKPYTPDQIFASLRAADAWRRELESYGDHGEIQLNAAADGGPFLGVTRLWSLLLARTAWSEDPIRQFGLALLEIGQNALEWGRQHRIGDIGAISYAIQPESVDVVVRGDERWLRSEELFSDASRDTGLLAFFDEVIRRSPSEIALVKRFSPADE